MAVKQHYKLVGDEWRKAREAGPFVPCTMRVKATVARRLSRTELGRSVPIVEQTRFRRTRAWYGEIMVGPSDDWGDFLHNLSHAIAGLRGEFGHSRRHALLEARLVRLSSRRGYLHGKLAKRPAVPAPQPSKAEALAAQIERLLVLMKAWESKKRRAENAIAKLGRRIRGKQVALRRFSAAESPPNRSEPLPAPSPEGSPSP